MSKELNQKILVCIKEQLLLDYYSKFLKQHQLTDGLLIIDYDQLFLSNDLLNNVNFQELL